MGASCFHEDLSPMRPVEGIFASPSSLWFPLTFVAVVAEGILAGVSAARIASEVLFAPAG